MAALQPVNRGSQTYYTVRRVLPLGVRRGWSPSKRVLIGVFMCLLQILKLKKRGESKDPNMSTHPLHQIYRQGAYEEGIHPIYGVGSTTLRPHLDLKIRYL
ncbi:unnamed protein product [Victoria cruziana]